MENSSKRILMSYHPTLAWTFKTIGIVIDDAPSRVSFMRKKIFIIIF